MLCLCFVHVLRVQAGVNITEPVPGDDLFLRPLGRIGREIPVGNADHRVFLHRFHDLHDVRRGAADVAFRLDRRRGVHVRHHGHAGILLFHVPQGELVRKREGDAELVRIELPARLSRSLHRDHIGHGAAGRDLRQEHGLVRREDGGAFRHEVHAAEHDDAVIRFCRGPGELQGIAGDVRDVLHLGPLVVVGQDDGVEVLFQLEDLVTKQSDIRHR